MNMNIDCLQLIEKTTGMLWKVTQYWLISQLVKLVVVYESHVILDNLDPSWVYWINSKLMLEDVATRHWNRIYWLRLKSENPKY